MTGNERRRLDPRKGAVKTLERKIDVFASRYIYPHLLGIWNPYSWILSRRFALAEISLAPPLWPVSVPPLKVLLVSDIHTGVFLSPKVLADTVALLMQEKPDLVAIAGDIVTGEPQDLKPFLHALRSFSSAPLGAWYCYGNHDYFGGDPEPIRQSLEGVGITTLVNESATLRWGDWDLVIAGIDDLILGKPDWKRLLGEKVPHLLLAHHPDFFYEAALNRIALTLSGHTHGGQIRPQSTPPLVRQSRFCFDEGAYSYGSSVLVVSRGLGSVGLPLRYGADPEAIMIHVQPSEKT